MFVVAKCGILPFFIATKRRQFRTDENNLALLKNIRMTLVYSSPFVPGSKLEVDTVPRVESICSKLSRFKYLYYWTKRRNTQSTYMVHTRI